METKDYITLALSVMSLGLSCTALYLTQFRRPRIKLSIGPDIHIHHPSNFETAIYLPVIFSNESPARGVIYQIVLELQAPNGSRSFLKWREEATISRDWQYSNETRAKPLTIDGHGSIAKVYWFSWPSNETPLVFSEGRYRVSVHAWATRRRHPDITQTEELVISAESAGILAENRQKRDPRSRYFYFEGRGIVGILAADEELRSVWDKNNMSP